MSFLACLPLIAVDIPAVLSLDQRCLGGLWTDSGYRKELESDCSDLFVLVSARERQLLTERSQLNFPVGADNSEEIAPHLAAKDPTKDAENPIDLLGMGCLWAILEEAHITTLAIEPAHQGQKMGLLLLTHLLLGGYNRGLTRATLEVRASNQKALALYRKLGFKKAGERRRYYSDGENACVLWRSQLQSEACLSEFTNYQQSAIAHIESTEKYRFFAKPA